MIITITGKGWDHLVAAKPTFKRHLNDAKPIFKNTIKNIQHASTEKMSCENVENFFKKSIRNNVRNNQYATIWLLATMAPMMGI